jgi:chorismate mutase
MATVSRSTRWFGLALVALLVSGCATTATFTGADTTAVDRLLELMKERLDVAPQVARIKWNTKAPIEDLAREKQIIDDVAKRASEYGLDPDVARMFFRAQIEASKAAQIALHAKWTASTQAPFANMADLNQDIRPALDRLTPLLLRALAEALPVIQQPGGRQLLEAHSHAILGNSRDAVTPLLTLAK